MSDDRLCIDLCSGLGGFSRAFVNAGWEVVTVDIDPKFKPTVLHTVTLPYEAYGEILRYCVKPLEEYSKVVVLASPPCQAFSIANAQAWVDTIPEGLQVATGCLILIRAFMRARDQVGKDTAFCLENPRGRMRWFLGRPKSVIRLKDYGKATRKPTDLWHNIPFKWLEADRAVKAAEGHHKARREIWMSEIERSPAKRAEMPLGLSQAIVEAVSEPKAAAREEAEVG